jgi:HlyD family secretion protein
MPAGAVDFAEITAIHCEEPSMFVILRNVLLSIGAIWAVLAGLSLGLDSARAGGESLLTVVANQPGEAKTDQEPEPADKEDADETKEGTEKKAGEPASAGGGSSEDEKEDEKNDAEEKDESDKQDSEKPAAAEKKSEDATKSDDAKKEAKKPKPFTVESKPLKIEQTLEGVFVASEMEEVPLRPDVWTRYTVVEAVPHGTEVKKGDVLVRFDDEDIEERLAEETIDQRLSELALMQAEEESPRAEKLLKLTYESAKRTHDQLVEDHKYYLETDRPFAERIANYRFDSAKEDLASQEEELSQLKKMYEADEITEETEEIVLRRQEFEVSTAKLMLELQTANRDYTLQVSLPRNDIYYTTALEEAKLTLEQARTAMELGTTRGKYDLEKKRAARTRSVQANAKLLGDRSLMEIKSPTDGTVYYGRCVTGQWAEIGSMTAKLVPFSMIPPNTVLMTVVKQRPLYVLTSVGEKEIIEYKDGLPATIAPVADDKLELKGKIAKLPRVPGGGKKFELQLDLDKSDLPEWLVAGMSCAVKVVTYDKKDALLVPVDMIQTDKDDEKIKYVMRLAGDDEEPVRRDVKLGKTKDKMVEVLSGLKAGDKIVKEEPKKEDEAEK